MAHVSFVKTHKVLTLQRSTPAMYLLKAYEGLYKIHGKVCPK